MVDDVERDTNALYIYIYRGMQKVTVMADGMGSKEKKVLKSVKKTGKKADQLQPYPYEYCSINNNGRNTTQSVSCAIYHVISL